MLIDIRLVGIISGILIEDGILESFWNIGRIMKKYIQINIYVHSLQFVEKVRQKDMRTVYVAT